MNRSGESVAHRRPWWTGTRLAFALAFVIGITFAGYAVVRSRIRATAPTWQEIERAKSRRQWTEMEAKLKRWIEANPDHARAHLMLADLRLGLGRRDEAVLGLSSVPISNPAWTQVQTMLGDLSIRDHEAARAEQFFRQASV